MKDLLKKDIKIKIGSVLIAMLFWLYVYNTADNPYTSKTFSNIPIKIENEASLTDKGLMIKNSYKTNVDITIRGRHDIVEKVRESDFEVLLDLSKIKSINDKVVEVIKPVCSQKDVYIESYTPNSVDIVLAKMKNNTFPVEIIPNITLKSGYKILKITPSMDKIMLGGEEALIDSVGAIRATLNVTDLDRDIVKNVNCKVYNKDNKEIASLGKNLNIDVKVEVGKEVPISIVVNGDPAKDYTEVMRSTTPAKACITGSPEILSKIDELKTEPISINNIRKNLNITSYLKIPDGVKLADTPNEVMVNIMIEQLALKNFTILKDELNIRNNLADLNYEVKTESAEVQLKGRLSEVSQLSIQNIRPGVDVTGLGEGIHKVPLVLNLPSQVKLTKDVYIEIKISKAE